MAWTLCYNVALSQAGSGVRPPGEASLATAAVLVELQDVGLRYGGRVALEAVDLVLHAGEIVTLVGLNGSGKSSLARIVVGLQAPEQGEVRRRPRLRIGYTPQHLARDPRLPLTVRGFVALAGPVEKRRVDEVLDEVGAADVGDAQLAEVSGGELNRVLLARALVRRPELLVLDEPMAGVDLAGRSALYRLIGELRDRYGCGVLMVSHDLHVVMAGTDTVLCLNHHVCCSGHPRSIARNPEFVALFGREVSDVLAVYPHSHDHAHDVHGDAVPLEHDGHRH